MPYRTNRLAVPITVFPLVPADPNRIALIFGTPNGNRVTVGTDPSLVDLGGINLPANSQPLSIDKARHGDLPSAAWYGISNVGTNSIGIIEVW